MKSAGYTFNPRYANPNPLDAQGSKGGPNQAHQNAASPPPGDPSQKKRAGYIPPSRYYATQKESMASKPIGGTNTPTPSQEPNANSVLQRMAPGGLPRPPFARENFPNIPPRDLSVNLLPSGGNTAGGRHGASPLSQTHTAQWPSTPGRPPTQMQRQGYFQRQSIDELYGTRLSPSGINSSSTPPPYPEAIAHPPIFPSVASLDHRPAAGSPWGPNSFGPRPPTPQLRTSAVMPPSPSPVSTRPGTPGNPLELGGSPVSPLTPHPNSSGGIFNPSELPATVPLRSELQGSIPQAPLGDASNRAELQGDFRPPLTSMPPPLPDYSGGGDGNSG